MDFVKPYFNMNDVTNPQAYPFTNIDDLKTLQKYNLDDNKMNENSSQEMRTWYYIKQLFRW